MMKKHVVRLAWSGLMFSLGVAAGATWEGMRHTAPLVMRTFEMVREAAEQRAYLRYRLGDYQTGKCSLLDYVDLARRLRGGLSPQGQELADRSVGLAYARIAAAAARSGYDEDMRAFMGHAQGAFRQMNEHPHEGQLLEVVALDDSRWDREVRGGCQPVR
jgi:hypothetical protein